MEIRYELYKENKEIISGDDFSKLYNYMMYNGIEYIFDDISYDTDISDNDDFNITIAIGFKGGYTLYLIVHEL